MEDWIHSLLIAISNIVFSCKTKSLLNQSNYHELLKVAQCYLFINFACLSNWDLCALRIQGKTCQPAKKISLPFYLFIFLPLFILFCECSLACLYVHSLLAWYHGGQKRTFDSPGAGVTGGREPPDTDAGNQTQFLWENKQSVLLAMEPSLQPHILHFMHAFDWHTFGPHRQLF